MIGLLELTVTISKNSRRRGIKGETLTWRASPLETGSQQLAMAARVHYQLPSPDQVGDSMWRANLSISRIRLRVVAWRTDLSCSYQ